MKQFLFQSIALVAVIFVGAYVSLNQDAQRKLFGILSQEDKGPKQAEFRIFDRNSDEKTISPKAIVKIELADTTEKRAQGLAGRLSIEQDQGMLFTFGKAGIYTFWMKGMKFPLDFVWIKDGEIIELTENVPNPDPQTQDGALPKYQSSQEVSELLEVNADFIKKHNIQVGDTVNTNY